MICTAETSESASAFLFKISDQETPEAIAAHVSTYLNPKTYNVNVLKFLVRLVCFNKTRLAGFQTVPRRPESCVHDGVSMNRLSYFLFEPTASDFEYIIHRLDAKSYDSLRSILFGTKQSKFRQNIIKYDT